MTTSKRNDDGTVTSWDSNGYAGKAAAPVKAPDAAEPLVDLDAFLEDETEEVEEELGLSGDSLVRDMEIPIGEELLKPDSAAIKAMDKSVLDAEYESKKDHIETIKAELEKGVSELVNSEEWVRYLDMQTKFHKYSLNNTLLIAIQNPDATDVAGYKTWQSLGRQVKKGEHGLFILRPYIANVVVEDKNGNPVRGADGKVLKERRCVGFGGTKVFDISQTSGKELPKVVHKIEGSESPGFREELESVIRESGYSVSYEPIPGSKNGYTTPEGNRVVVDSNMPKAQQVKTLAHELAHIKAGHMEDLENYHVGPGGCRGRMEVEAESISYIMLKANGMDGSDYSFGYVAGWAKGDTAKIRETADVVQRTSHKLLSDYSWANAQF